MEEQTRELFLKEDRKKTIHCGWHWAVGKILEENGQNVIYTRTTDVYQTPFQKATIGNEARADFFVSIHRNSSPVAGQYSGVETLVYERSGIKEEMAENINRELEEAGFENLGVKERPGLVVLRRTKMPAVLVEAGFINNGEDNRIFDENFEEVAQAIADGILQTIYAQEVESYEYEKEAETPYRIQLGFLIWKKMPGHCRHSCSFWDTML